MSCEMNPHIGWYLERIESGECVPNSDRIKLAALVRRSFETEDVYTDGEQLEKYLSLQKYLGYELLDWEIFLTALHLCTYWRKTGMPRWPDILLMCGRGTGKDGFLTFLAFCLASPYCEISRGYDVDICANNEDQAMRPVSDLIILLEHPDQRKKLDKFFTHHKERVVGRKTGAVVRGRPYNPKGLDGLRSGVVYINEIHQYENYAMINVFKTALGKKAHPRMGYFTTNGDVREGPLDDLLEQAEDILNGSIPDEGFLPFICRLDSVKDAENPEMFPKANPSYQFFPDLREEILKEWKSWKRSPDQNRSFLVKRMNLTEGRSELAAASWDDIKASDRPVPELEGEPCVVGIDFTKTTDWAAVNAHFLLDDDTRVDINHAWICLRSPELSRIKAPWREWVERGLLTAVDDVEISPRMITEYLRGLMEKYNVLGVAIDNFRFTLMKQALEELGFTAGKDGNICLVKPQDIMKVVPVMDSIFVNHQFVWGDNPVLRWAANNTKKVASSRKIGSDTGNYYYAKIEAKSRKTDPFMALVSAVTIEDLLRCANPFGDIDLGALIQ